MGDKTSESLRCRVNLGASPIWWETGVRRGQAAAASATQGQHLRLSQTRPSGNNWCQQKLLRVKNAQFQTRNQLQLQHKLHLQDYGTSGCSLCWFQWEVGKKRASCLLQCPPTCRLNGLVKGFPVSTELPIDSDLKSKDKEHKKRSFWTQSQTLAGKLRTITFQCHRLEQVQLYGKSSHD